MSIAFLCGECGKELHANERAVGRRVRCPDCATLLEVPDPATMEEELEEEAGGEGARSGDRATTGWSGDRARTDDRARTGDPHPSPLPEGGGTPELVELEPLEELEPMNRPPRVMGQPKRKKKKKLAGEGAAVGAWEERELPPLAPPARGQTEDLIDMTAMVDIVFFLLIFFLVTSLTALESVMNMPVPQASEGGISTGRSMADLENDPNMITVRIEDDDSIWVEDAQVFNDQELALKLRAARQEGPRSLLVIGHADASHGAAVRVFDAGAGAGVNGISLIVQENLQ